PHSLLTVQPIDYSFALPTVRPLYLGYRQRHDVLDHLIDSTLHSPMDAVLALAPRRLVVRTLCTLAVSTAVYAGYTLAAALYRHFTSHLRLLPGPASTHWFWGNSRERIADQDRGLLDEWAKLYGRVYRTRRMMGGYNLVITDTKAIHHFLTQTGVYQKSKMMRSMLGRIVGPGILVVEGEQHRNQRKIMNPAFGLPQVRELTEIFIQKSVQLRDVWLAAATSSPENAASVEALSALSKTTLDIIGLAGFNHDINALAADAHTQPDELADAFEKLFEAETGFDLLGLFISRVPLMSRLPTKQYRTTKAAQARMIASGRRLLAESKREVQQNGSFASGTGRARDLLALLVKANMDKDIPESQRLSDEDVLAQVPTFLVAGHETTSTAVTWALFALTQHKSVQDRLREEVRGVATDFPTFDELNSLPYLDCIVKETLRLYPPVTQTSRVAVVDDVLPLEEPFTDIHGIAHSSLLVKQGQIVLIPIAMLNRDKSIWGEDALEFKPGRWDSSISNSIPGIYSHMLTFIGGPRNCIGYRFALAEMKALLFTLVRSLEFELGVPAEQLSQKGTAIVMRPIVLSEPEKGNQLPLIVRPVSWTP
ncbi:unnamed protein product, partial [Mycena citricolor]